jgi:uncharacterized repeat protein (TIGR02543 family)
MKNEVLLLLVLFSAVLVFGFALPASAGGTSSTLVTVPDRHAITSLTAVSPRSTSWAVPKLPKGQTTPMVAAGNLHIVGLATDGKVPAAGDNSSKQCNVASWTNIIQIAAGGDHTVGLKANGTVIAVGANSSGQRNIADWRDVIEVSAGNFHTVGVDTDGTVIAAGSNAFGQCDVGNWANIANVAAGGWHTVGLKGDGTVVAAGYSNYGQCDVSAWSDITEVAAGGFDTIGLKLDGTVVATGNNNYGQCNVGNWTGIIQVAAGYRHTVGLKGDGTVIAVGDNDYGQCNVGNWTSIVRVAAGYKETVGLMADGTVVVVGVLSGTPEWNLGSAAVYLTIYAGNGGEVTGPGEGTFAYYPGTLLPLVATPENGYHFVGWTGDVDTVRNVNAARTTIVTDDNYSLTADFEKGSPISWPIAGAVTGAVVLVGLVTFFVRRKRAVRTNNEGAVKAGRTRRR